MTLKITNIGINFPENQRSIVTVEFNRSVFDESFNYVYVAKYNKDFDVWIYRADFGDFVNCIAEPPRVKDAFPKHISKLRLKDGMHTVRDPAITSGPAVNAAFPELDPVIDVKLAGETVGGHVNVLALGRILALSGDPVAVAVVRWPNGVVAYEVIRDAGEDSKPNREGDTLLYMQTAGNPVLRLH